MWFRSSWPGGTYAQPSWSLRSGPRGSVQRLSSTCQDRGKSMKGRQVVIREYGKPFEIHEYDVPDPRPGDILLKVTQAGICGSDLHTWRGDTENNPIPPQGRAMGHEGSGVVHKLGQGVTTDALGNPLHEGDRVIHTAIIPCHHCPQCLRGDHNLCVNRVPRTVGEFPYSIGTFADYYNVTPRQPVFKVPDELS